MTQFFSEAPGAAPAAQQDTYLDWVRMAQSARAHAPEWSVAEAYFAVLFAAATCDGTLGREEQETLLALVHRSRALKALSTEDLAAVNTAVVERLRQGGDEALANACTALPANLRLPTFAQALDIILCDGELVRAEAAFLNKLVADLQLARADVERVADVLLLKNRC